MVDEHADQPVAHGLVEQRRRDGRVHAAAQAAEGALARELGAVFFDGALGIAAHVPGAGAAADFIEEVAEYLRAALRVRDLGVELHAVEPLGVVFHRGDGAFFSGGRDCKALGRAQHAVGVAHPAGALAGAAGKEGALAALEPDAAILAGGPGGAHLAALKIRHELAAVADAEHGHARVQHAAVAFGRAGFRHALRAAGENDALAAALAESLHGGLAPGKYLGVDALLADAAGDEAAVLAAEVDYEYLFLHFCLQITRQLQTLRGFWVYLCRSPFRARRNRPAAAAALSRPRRRKTGLCAG